MEVTHDHTFRHYPRDDRPERFQIVRHPIEDGEFTDHEDEDDVEDADAVAGYESRLARPARGSEFSTAAILISWGVLFLIVALAGIVSVAARILGLAAGAGDAGVR